MSGIDKSIILSISFLYLEPVTGGTGAWIVSCNGMYILTHRQKLPCGFASNQKLAFPPNMAIKDWFATAGSYN